VEVEAVLDHLRRGHSRPGAAAAVGAGGGRGRWRAPWRGRGVARSAPHLQRLAHRALEVVVPQRRQVLVHVRRAHELLAADARQFDLAVVLLRQLAPMQLPSDRLALGEEEHRDVEDRPPEARVALPVVELTPQRPDLVEEQPDGERLHRRAREAVDDHAERVDLVALYERHQQQREHILVADELAALLLALQRGRRQQRRHLNRLLRERAQLHDVRRQRALAGTGSARQPHDVLWEDHLASAVPRLDHA
jgi:hypothetical protein